MYDGVNIAPALFFSRRFPRDSRRKQKKSRKEKKREIVYVAAFFRRNACRFNTRNLIPQETIYAKPFHLEAGLTIFISTQV